MLPLLFELPAVDATYGRKRCPILKALDGYLFPRSGHYQALIFFQVDAPSLGEVSFHLQPVRLQKLSLVEEEFRNLAIGGFAVAVVGPEVDLPRHSPLVAGTRPGGYLRIPVHPVPDLGSDLVPVGIQVEGLGRLMKSQS